MGLAVLMALIMAPGAEGQEFVNRRDEARGAFLATGQGIYAHYCAHCHGEDGQGSGRLWATELTPKPADLTATKLDPDALVKFITEGSAASGKSNLCPPWGRTIPPQAVERLALYLLSLRGDTPSPSSKSLTSPAPPHQSFPWLLAIIILVETVLLGWLLRRRKARNGTALDPAVHR